MMRGGAVPMTVREAVQVVEGQFYCGEEWADSTEVHSACGSDLMSDVMAFVKEQVLLLTGLVNPQVIRTAELLDIKVIVFVRGKHPTLDMVDMARDAQIILAGTKYPMYIACGKLYEAGLRSGGTRKI
jgi:orotidine-5'-phosphate decarboxylase